VLQEQQVRVQQRELQQQEQLREREPPEQQLF
jgi:hypothetical protein